MTPDKSEEKIHLHEDTMREEKKLSRCEKKSI